MQTSTLKFSKNILKVNFARLTNKGALTVSVCP